jgi:predicted histone-like DNA-binding protein
LKTNPECYLKWYARAVPQESVDIDSLAEHMHSHNTPYSTGCIKGILTDMVTCIKELLLAGNTVRIDNLAIFSVGIVNKKGCEDKSDYKVTEYVDGVKLCARAIGELSSSQLNLDSTLKRSALDKLTDTNPDLVTGEEDSSDSSEDDEDEELKNVLG